MSLFSELSKGAIKYVEKTFVPDVIAKGTTDTLDYTRSTFVPEYALDAYESIQGVNEDIANLADKYGPKALALAALVPGPQQIFFIIAAASVEMYAAYAAKARAKRLAAKSIAEAEYWAEQEQILLLAADEERKKRIKSYALISLGAIGVYLLIIKQKKIKQK